ncbi:TonB-dependent receptor [Olivibacter domesticus]|uniref:TonB-linked outer membrane protein, SusC/RagA family n=1 Tax=Olivibacter domesticus TaxID=407022 RepID=A0A1H7GD03_OLID1|nr:TonB-dependent receptor [Olivibacter domesticus]SEK36156.1 TonB-linked outer membrane protein, SusC/RagA family [Olivibacter domesticus]
MINYDFSLSGKEKILLCGIHQLFRIMKLTSLLLFIGFLHLSAASRSQTISLNIKSQPIGKVFEAIEKQTNLTVVYNDRFLNPFLPISIQVKNKPLTEALESMLKPVSLTYHITKNAIVITETPTKENKRISAPAIGVQQETVSGQVTDDQGKPLEGTTVSVRGTTIAVTTNAEGRYRINVPANGKALLFTLVGFEALEKPINNQHTIDASLKTSISDLDEVVVIGYGTQRKSDLTGSISSVKVNELNSVTTTSVDGLLNGVPGVNVIQNSGEPGAGFSINIRGASSISASNNPLYVIDGFPVDNSPALGSGSDPGFSENRSPRNPLASINPRDIESIEILKDASATAIYGSRGANGVILITTKSGQAGDVKVSLHASGAIQTPFSRLNLLSATEYKEVLNQLIDAGGASEEESIGDIANGGLGTDWQEEVTNQAAIMQNHQLSFTGGTDRSKYFLSLNYVDQDGIVKTTDFNRYGLRLNLDSKVSDRFKIGLNASTSYVRNTFAPNGFSTNETAGALYAAMNFDPTLGIKGADGNYALSPSLSIDNPMALLYGTSSKSSSNRILTTITGEYTILPELNFKINVGGDIVNEKRKNYIGRLTKNGRNTGGIGSNYQGERSSYLAEGTFNYDKKFGLHAINGVLGGSFQRFASSRTHISANGFPSDATNADNLSLGIQETYVIDNPSTGNKLASLIGRINYMFDNTYSATVTVRRDGSSRFGENNRYGTFPSAALAWKISEEEFLKGNRLLNQLKVRTSWGLTGNQEIGDFAYQSTYNGGIPAIWDGQLVTTAAPARLPNPDLKWEQTEQIDVGLDFGLFDNRINGSIDFYQKTTTDMLLNLPIPQSTGFANILTNIGKIQNKGVDITLSSTNISRENFRWTTDLSMTTLKNKVIDLGGLPQIFSGGGFLHVEQIGIIRPGEPLNSFFGWEVAGVWQQDDDYSFTKEKVQAGDLKYVDQNGDGYVNGDDRVNLGNSFPDFQWSLGNTISLHGFELYLYLEGVEGAQMLNGNLIDSYFPINFRRNKFAEPYLNRWTPENPSNVYPSFVSPLSQGRKTINSLTVQDASYIRLKNVRISYNIPDRVSWLPSGQVYLSAENLFVITDYDGLDPSINPNNNPSLRLDFNSYPTARTFLLGFRFDF